MFKTHPRLVLVACGSVSSWIRDNIVDNKAFVGRRSLDVVVPELPLSDCVKFWGTRAKRIDPREITDVLSVTGGVPRYLEEVNPRLSAAENIRRLCYMPNIIFDVTLEELEGIDSVMGLAFENLVVNNYRELIPLLHMDGALVTSAGPYRRSKAKGRRGETGCQVDLLIQTRRALCFVEVKRKREIGREVIDEVDREVRKAGFGRILHCGDGFGGAVPTVEQAQDFIVEGLYPDTQPVYAQRTETSEVLGCQLLRISLHRKLKTLVKMIEILNRFDDPF